MGKRLIKLRYPAWFILPFLIIFGVLYLFPTLSGFYYSFTDWNLLRDTDIRFIGFDQFRMLFQSGEIWNALEHTFIYAALVTVLQNVFGFGLALVLNSVMPGKTLLRAIFFTPMILSALIVGYMFTSIYHPTGLLNQFLSTIGLGFLQQEWLGNADIALYSVIMAGVWQSTGFSMAIYLAGLQTVPKDMLEAAEIDGATYWQRLKSILIPFVAPSFTINIVYSTVTSLKVFDLIFVMTKGGPGDSTEVMNSFVLKQFGRGMYGYGTAANLILFLIITAAALLILFFTRRKEMEA
ncbi:carbohydrate ABC transporter permease [Paenibacillus yanchengensis]|uniref:Carbohydrate ABC transporter permease n=1 Tax=Paenibacillus yanchengensis TaxID=2035833 RepID=A0ABW4YJB3_9BACL